MDSLSSGGKGVGSVFDQANLSFGQWAVGLGSALPVIIDVTAALGALTASLGAATAGAGALAVGGGGAGAVGFGGIFAIAKPAIQNLKDLKTAQDAYTLAVQQYGKHSTQARTAFAKLRVEQKRAGPEAAKFAGSLSQIERHWEELTKAGQRDFFGLLNDGIDRLNRKLPMLAKSANTSMRALRGGFDQFLKKATGPEFNKFIDVMTRTFAHSMRPIGDAFGNIAKILERIAVAVGPDVVRIIKQLDDVTKGWVQSTKDASGLRDTIHGLVNQTETWAKLIVQAGKLIVAVLVPGMGQGQKAVKGITATLKEWTDWVNQHPAQMRDFFKQGLETTKELGQVLLGFLPMLFQISTAMRPIARFFLAVVKGLNSLKLGNVSALTVLLGAMVGVKIATGIAGLVRTIGTLRAAWLGVRAAATGAAAAEATAGAAGEGGMISTAASRSVLGGAGGAAAGKTFGTRFLAGFQTALAAGGGLALAAGTKKAVEEASHSKSALSGLGSVVKNLIGGPTGLGLKGLSELTGSQIPNNLAKLLNPVNQVGRVFKVVANPINSARDALHGVTHPAETAANAFHALVGAAKDTTSPLDKAAKDILDKYGTIGNATALLRQKYGSLAKAGKHMSDVQKDAFISLATQARDKGIITQKQLDNLTSAIKGLQVKGSTALHQLRESASSSLNSLVGATDNAKKKVGDKTRDMAKTVGKNTDSMVNAVVGGIGRMGKNTNKALRALNAKQVKFGVDTTVNAALHKQRGGRIGGTGVGDKIPAMLEPEEFVVNSKASKKHRALLEEINFRDAPRFATGGFAGMQPGITRLAKSMIQRFGGYLSSGLRPGDPGFHGRGMAADIVPAKWGAATRYANAIGPRLLEGIHQGPPGQNVSWDSGHKVSPGFWGGATWAEHVSHIHLAIAGAAKGLGGAIAELKRIVLKGPPGALRDMGQGSLDKTYEAAKAYLAKQQPALSTDTALIQGSGNVERVFAKVAKKLSRSKTATLALGEAGFAESGMRDLSYGSGSSQGALQLLASTAAGLGVSPHDEGAVASIFFTRGFAGRGGANALAAQGLPAYQVAQGVQGSADASGSNYRAQEGAAKSWMRRFGLQKGGVVGPYVGSFAKGGEVAETGLAHVHKGETVVPGMQRGGVLRRLEHEARVARRRAHRVEQRIQHEQGTRHPDRDLIHHLKKLEKRLQAHEDTVKELISEDKQLRAETRESNHLTKTVRVNERAALRAVVNLTANQIGAQGLQKTRNASPGRAARY